MWNVQVGQIACLRIGVTRSLSNVECAGRPNRMFTYRCYAKSERSWEFSKVKLHVYVWVFTQILRGLRYAGGPNYMFTYITRVLSNIGCAGRPNHGAFWKVCG